VLIEEKPPTKVCSECGKEVPADATECPYCGCPLDEPTLEETSVSAKQTVNEQSNKKGTKIIIPIVAVIAIVAIVLVVYNVRVVMPRNTYNEAMELLEKGKYNDADGLLKKIENYNDVAEIREELKYESCAYSAVNAVKEILKNPDSISVYEVKFYSGRDIDNSEDTEGTESEEKESDTIIDEDHPYIIIHLGAQNGFGGNAESYALCIYSKENDAYKLDAYTKSDNIEDIKEDYDSDDDNYFMYMLGAALISGYEENGIEVGSIDMDRFKAVLKNDSYSTIKIIE
jgi:hypothetical protein